MRRARRLAVIVGTAVMLAGCTTNPPPSPSPSPPATPAASTPAPTATLSGSPPPTDPNAASARWEQVTPGSPAPAARFGHTWVGDPSTGVAYLFGGQGPSEPLGDLWTYDLAADAWRQPAVPGEAPAARSGHTAAWIDGLGYVVFGGRLDARVADDLWAYDPDAGAWRAVETSGPTPPARTDACAAMRPDGRWWISHGSGAAGNPLDDTWAFDSGASAWTKVRVDGASPPALRGSACWWADADQFVLVGGREPDGEPSGDSWVLTVDSDAARWQRLSGALPPRSASAATETSEGLVIFGGSGDADAHLDDLYRQDRQTLEVTPFRPSDASPSTRSGGSLVDDPGGERVLLFGGLDAAGPSGELWSLRLS